MNGQFVGMALFIRINYSLKIESCTKLVQRMNENNCKTSLGAFAKRRECQVNANLLQ